MNRACGLIEFRAVDDEQRILEGTASTDALDDYGTVLEPQGARFTLPLPLLWQHDKHTPVGDVLSADVTKKRITVRAQIRNIPEPGPLKDACDRAWQAVKYKLVRGFSVGFLPLDGGTKGNRFTGWTWKELSLVTLPGNEEATIAKVRSASAVSGAHPTPVVTGPGNQPNDSTNPRRKMTLQEQIQQHENSRAAKVARQTALMERAGTEGATLAPNEAEEYDTLTSEVDAIDGHLARLNTLKRSSEARAVPVNGNGTAAAAQSRGGVPVVTVRDNLPAGIGMARYAMALLSCNGNRFEAAEYARRTWGDSAEPVALHLRAAIAAGTTTDATWALPLVPTNFLNEFLELLRPATLIGRIPGLRRVPFNISMPSQTAGGSYGWTGEGKAKRVTKLAFGTVTLGMAKATGIIVLTKELVRSSSPAAQEVVRADMIAGIGQFLDTEFIDPTVAEDAGVSPASITYGVTGNPSTGSSEAQIRADLLQLLGGFPEGIGLGGIVLLMSESSALALGMVVNAVGAQAFPGIGATGGTLLGLPVITSNTVGDQIVAVHAPSVLFADDGGVEIDVSEQASLQMDSEPTEPTAAATVMVSLWQRNLVGLRAERFINWKKARTGAVRRITDVDYVPADAS